MKEWVVKDGFFDKVVSQTVVEPEVPTAKLKMMIVAIEIAVSIVAATTLCEAMQAIEETIRRSSEPAFKRAMTTGPSPSFMTLHNQGVLPGSQKREILGKYTVDKLVDGVPQRVNFDKQRIVVLSEFLKTQVSDEDYKAATPQGNYRSPKAVPNVADVQRVMGVYVLKTICAVALRLKEQLGGEDVPAWTDLAYLRVEEQQSECTKIWTQAITTYLQSSLRPKHTLRGGHANRSNSRGVKGATRSNCKVDERKGAET